MKTFIEIGACDFDTLVHLSDEGWQGIVVEPIREYYNNIERKPNVFYENAAVDWNDGYRVMFQPSKEKIKSTNYYKGKNSFLSPEEFDKDVNIPVYVRTISYFMLLHHYNVGHIDYLKVDTEGYDYEILKMAMMHPVKPRKIKIEIEHLTPFLDEIKSLLEQNGYMWEHTPYDLTAYMN